MERELEKDEWRAFFDAFSREHEGWLITLDCDRIGCAFRDMPLRAIVAGDDVIEVFVLAPDGAHMAHVVRRPSHVFAGEVSEDGDVDVTILNSEGKRTVVQCRSAVPAGVAERSR